MFYVYLTFFFVVLLISIFWVRGIDFMKNNYPDYKGEDFLDWGIDKEDEDYIY